jgi:cell division protein ZapA (FtsZ GTPase activity inhibitor)
MKSFKEIKSLPNYLQPKILSAVAFINSASPNLDKAVERINTLSKHLSEKEIMWVMSLLTFEKLLELVKESPDFAEYTKTMKARTIN